MNMSDIFAATSATASMQVLKHCSIIWKLHHTCTTVRVVQKYIHVSAICVDIYQHMALKVSISIQYWHYWVHVLHCITHTNKHTQSFNGLLFRTTQVGRYLEDRPFWIFWSRDDGVAVAWVGPYASLLHLSPDSTSSVQVFLQAGCECSSCHPTNIIKALKAY